MIIKETTVQQFTMQYLLQTHDLTVLNEYYDSQYVTDLHQLYLRLSQTTMVDSIHWQSSEITSQRNHNSLRRSKPE